ncbi:MAG: phosphatase PAP2 family protein [Pseudomonadota bacterium]|nr:phosphatase PAP2 family protein [Pseudomonadota bacterium]
MPKNISLRALTLVALLLIFLVSGITGGAGFEPDAETIRDFQHMRIQSPQLTIALVRLTHLGSVYFTLGGGLLAAAWLALSGERRRGAILAVAVIVERLTVDGLKLLLDRARPAFDAHPVATHSSSFPSGHSGNSMGVFLAIALIAAPERWRREAAVLAVMLSVAIGLTRPYLGVHWPTDVLGGWSLGAIVAILAATWANRQPT